MANENSGAPKSTCGQVSSYSPATAATARLRRQCGLLVVALAIAVGAMPAAAQHPPTQVALIINGDDSFTHNHNVDLALGALGQLGYAPEHTYVFTPGDRHEGMAPAVHQLPASGDALAATLHDLKRWMGPSDLLLVYLTGHGARVFGRPLLVLEHNATVGPKDLAKAIGELAFDRLILIADQCYSGAFVDAFTALGRNLVAVSSVDRNHEVRCEPFVRPLWAAAVDRASRSNGEDFVAVETAFQIGEQTLVGSLGQVKDGIHPQYAATGTCRGHHNSFSLQTVAVAAVSAPATVGTRR
jgi:hypothetical protein